MCTVRLAVATQTLYLLLCSAVGLFRGVVDLKTNKKAALFQVMEMSEIDFLAEKKLTMKTLAHLDFI